MLEKEVNFEVDESHVVLWENPDWRYAFVMGGRGNGRSGTASRYCVSQLLGKEYTRGAMMRAVLEDIRASCWGEINDRLAEQDIKDQFRVVENNMFLEHGQNSMRAHGFRASSGSLTARLKSLAGYNLIWIEEGEEIGEDEFRKLDDSLRTVKGRIRVIFTLNTPPKNHWILREFFDLTPSQEAPGFFVPRIKEGKNAIYIPGTWRENEPNLDAFTIQKYQAYKDNKPSYYWQVIEGLAPEEVRGKIYTGWQQIDSVPVEARLVKGGEDFGWFPDPACVCAIYYWNGAYVIDELAFGTELTNEFLAGEWKKVAGNQSVALVADSAEPKSIAEQRKYGIIVQGAEKGRDSVNFRIKVTTQKKIYVTRRSTNIWQSYENYSWAEDRDGNPKGEPKHEYSHAMDAVSYAIASMHNKTSDIRRPEAPRERKNIAI